MSNVATVPLVVSVCVANDILYHKTAILARVMSRYK